MRQLKPSRPINRRPSFTLRPVAQVIALLLVAGAAEASPRPFSSDWFAAKGASQGAAANPNRPGAHIPGTPPPLAQQQKDNAQLQRSIANIGRTAASIAAQQAAQKAARDAARQNGSHVPEGYTQGGLWDRNADGNQLNWKGAEWANGTPNIGDRDLTIKQTESKAILNWDTFNIGRDTSLEFQQNAGDAVLNRVVGNEIAPSQIAGQLKADGTVMVINQNGVIFTGSSQTNVRNMVAAAGTITDSQFENNGLYNGNNATITNAAGDVVVEQGAQITTHKSETSTQGGGYVLLLGQNVDNAGEINTTNGQTAMAAGDNFIIKKGYATTDGDLQSTVRGNVITAAGNGTVTNSGIIQASIGDISLTGNQVKQEGVLLASTSVNNRGTVHLNATGTDANVTLGEGSTTAILLEDTDTTALDSQRDGLQGPVVDNANQNIVPADKYRRDQSLVEISSSGTVDFANDSMTLATGGQIAVNASERSLVRDGATLDVSGATGVKVSMESNSVKVNIQGNELRDSPNNRDEGNIGSNDVWVDVRDLVYIPAGTNGHDSDRWYTAGGLLEVAGYLGTQGHSVGEWMAQGGSVIFAGNDVVTQQGSQINISGGTLDVQTGEIQLSWLRGADGNLYEVSSAPGDLLYTGIYSGFERNSERWGQKESWWNPLITPKTRLENGYTVGRDAGTLVIGTRNAVLEGDIVGDTYQGDRQTQAAQQGLDGYYQSQKAVARGAQLVVGEYVPFYVKNSGTLQHRLTATGNTIQKVIFNNTAGNISAGLELDSELPDDRQGTLVLNADQLNGFNLGAIKVAAGESITVENDLAVGHAGNITLYGPQINVNADLTARSGSIHLGNVVNQIGINNTNIQDVVINAPAGTAAGVTVAEGVNLDASGLWSNLLLNSENTSLLPYQNGGNISIRSSGDVTLSEGSLIDVTSGAAILVDGGQQGGRGGNVTLQAGLLSQSGSLVLDGDIQGHGVNGGGSLTVQAGSAIYVGDDEILAGGYLEAGEPAPITVLLNEPITQGKGDILLADASYNQVVSGQTLESAITFSNTGNTLSVAVGSGGWDLTALSNLDVYVGSTRYRSIRGETVPEGAVITRINAGTLPAGYKLPDSLASLPTPTYTVTVGQVAPMDTTLAVGTAVAAGAVFDQRVAVQAPLVLESDFFDKGFGHYNVVGQYGVTVAEGAQVDVTMPVMRLNEQARGLATGSDPSEVLERWTSPVYMEDPIEGQLAQRQGASLSLQAGSEQSSVGDMANVQAGVGRRAVVNVDPGQSIDIHSIGQLTVDGTLNAWGGQIELGSVAPAAGIDRERAEAAGHGHSIWIGENAVLDVAGRAVTTVDVRGQRYGQVNKGGSIVIGGAFDPASGIADAANLFVVVREGALLDASGASAVLDIPGQGAVEVASKGGDITLTSGNGLYLDGTMLAASGGAGAAGGSLTVALETPLYRSSGGVVPDERVRRVREFVLIQENTDSELARGIDAGEAADQLVYGQGRLGVDQIDGGGFDNLTVLSNGLLSFEGDLSLNMGQSLNLYTGALGLTDAANEDSRITLAAPYVGLAGAGATSSPDNYIRPTVRGGITSISTQAPAGVFEVNAGQLLELRDGVAFGARGGGNANIDGLGVVVDRRAFDNVELVSQGDMRFLATTVTAGTVLNTSGDLTLAAAQIYPATGANATVYAGWRGNFTDYDSERTLRVMRTTEEVPDVPYSVFGSLLLGADTIEQGGILRAPLGSVQVGQSPSSFRTTKAVNLLDGSLISVSAAGLVMPYGGTKDGLTWEYEGEEVQLHGAGSLEAGSVTLTGQLVDVQEGAVIDLSGGGELTGAGFVSGRGGSTDARYNPLVQIGTDGFTLPGLDSNPVYAIVPGVQSVAPGSGEAGAVDPMVGQQVTIGTGVSGLPAGTYTLMPSTYALLPGAFRVEINGLAGQGAVTPATAARNGSFSIAGIMSIAGSGIRDSLASQLILTPADTLRTYSQYNETNYADFVRADAARLGVPRALIESDAKTLLLQFPTRDAESEELSFYFDGTVLGEAHEDGYGSTLAVVGSFSNARIEIMADGTLPNSEFEVAVQASDLNRIEVNRMVIGSRPQVDYGQGGNLLHFNTPTGTARAITVRRGATLSAPEVMLISYGVRTDSSSAIEIEQGAVINTLAQGDVAYDSTDGFIYQPGNSGVVAVSNGQLQWLAPENSSGAAGPSAIRIGGCAADDCTGTTQLYSEGSIAFVTNNDFELDDDVRYGTRHLSLGVGAFNIGSAEALAAAAARNALTPGLALNQQTMERLLQGDENSGAPALETLELIAADSVNFFESVTLSTLDENGESLLDNLLLTTPAIYGYGAANDVALIETGHLVWNGAAMAPGAVVTGGAGTGSGTLAVDAEQITFGYGPWAQPDGISSLDRLALGFANVNLSASDRVTANNQGSLAVYQSQGAHVAGEGAQYSGGNLTITTPLMTGEAGSVNHITAGGAINVLAPEVGAADPADISALGAELSLTAGHGLNLDTTVALPSGKLELAANGDLTLGDNAHLDLAGRSVEFFDDEEATQYSWGGDVSLESSTGNITQTAGSIINVSAEHNQAGRVTAIALGEAAGRVDLQGQILGSASGYYEAGGTYVPYLGGGIVLRAQQLGAGSLSNAFAELNQRLNDGEVNGLRSFQLKQGDLTIGNEVQANQIEVSLDGGHLTVAGTVDASGERVGAIRLAANNGLTLTGDALLDAHGSMLRLDSYGQIIDAPNRAMVELNSGDGLLTLANGARIDLRHGTADKRVQADPSLHDGRDRGTLELNAPRLGGATAGDIDIDAGGSLDIQGARSIALNAVQRYDDAAYGTDEAASGRPYQIIDQAYLDAKHADSTVFINAALLNDNLLNIKLAGLNNARYANVLHLRPGVELVSATPDGDLIVSGDLDLSGHRYASLNPHTQRTSIYGSGEVGALAIRAGGDLSIYGSVNDGFAPPPATPDDNGWVLTPGVQAYGGDVIVPGAGVELAKGTTFPVDKTLNYAVPIEALTLPANTELPVTAELAADLIIPANTVLSAAVRDADGNILYAAGTLLDQATTLPRGSQLEAGSRLPNAIPLTAMTWPAGVPLPVAAILADNTLLPVGALIPSMTDVKLVGDAISVPLRPVSGDSMGKNWAVAAMLPEGSQSWSIRLVAGADTEAADPRLRQHGATGRLILADTHYSVFEQRGAASGREPVWHWDPATGETGPVPQEYIDAGYCEITGYCILVEPEPEGEWHWDPATGESGPVPQEYVDAGYCDIAGYCVFVESEPEPKGEWHWDPATGETGPVPQEYVDQGYCDIAGYCVFVPEPDGEWHWDPATGETGPVPQEYVDAGYCDIAGYCVFIPNESGEQGDVIALYPVAQNFSVIRTGTGDLELLAASDVSMQSLYGIYTAGTSTSSRAGTEADSFNRARSTAGDGSYLHTGNSADEDVGEAYEALVNGGADSTYAAWYPDGGGNLLLRAGGNLTGDLIGSYAPGWPGEELRPQRSSVDQGNWLWRQGSGDTVGVDPIATGWWINFGTYVPGTRATDQSSGNYGLGVGEQNAVASIPELVGFTGIGTLGGGNLTIDVDGDAGMLARRGVSHNSRPRSEGLVLAVGSTGRVTESGELLLTGGGDLNLRFGGELNPGLQARATGGREQNLNLNGVLSNLRGGLRLQAGEIGGVALTYYSTSQVQTDGEEIRAFDPYTSSLGTAGGGLVLMLGDSAATLATRGDLVLAGTGDPGRVSLPYVPEDNGYSWFSLWTENTAINLLSAGGDLTPNGRLWDNGTNTVTNYTSTDGRYIFPSQLSAVAAEGSIYLDDLMLAPATQGSLALLAGKSIYANGNTVSQSGANVSAMPTPFTPAFAIYGQDGYSVTELHNLAADAIVPDPYHFSLFSFESNTFSGEERDSAQPARLYARDGDIVGLSSGEVLVFNSGGRAGQTWYEGAGPIWMRAGRDIVRSGGLLGDSVIIPNAITRALGNTSNGTGRSTSNLLVHNSLTDVSIIEAGRDILYSSFDVAGPGTLEVRAGRNILMVGQADRLPNDSLTYGETAITSLGPIVPGDNRPGASIVMQAGMGPGVDFAGFLDLYLNPENLADADLPLADQEGKVAKTYEAELIEWLEQRYGFVPSSEDSAVDEALAFFAGLGVEQQRVLGRKLYFAELKAGGREYNDADGSRFGSYLRGRNAIAALFPTHDVAGNAIAYAGDILMYGGAGVHTNMGGDIQMLTPGGAQTFGVEGAAPPSTAGVITRGQGDIQLYSRDSILLGQSRVMTTFGGDILGWSAEGDINAGRGSNTTVVYTPPSRMLDQWGNVTLSPDVPSTGAGIATLNPIPEIEPGDIDLIAPLGTVDAGEAGIRVSGSVNVAALQVLNADNIQVQGESTGIPVAAAVNVGALTSASQAASSAVTAAEQVNQAARRNLPSIISVEILGYGDERLEPSSGRNDPLSYNQGSPVQVLGVGPVSEEGLQQMTEEERLQF
ncbi:filamentous hemagglutinin family N-terminal domain-containing protein [Halopseudomonas litoralis]|uniref:Filamentous hemagglutinin family N-terminal domain-containing protein n=1 Tax=Halopseudomonas litoralis TaxID=797277 RepID=A0A1H1Q503_9GAMM|nr:filamentous haemagglutinin family protein [Halopseudomonas litoralis]SDS18505.1 filamentous hemagglutinin family N-terminal domain-containing protein [Halopseudomonas litoralis]